MVQILALEPNVVPIYKTVYVLQVTVLMHIQKHIKAITRPSSQLLASKELRLSAHDHYLKMGVPRRGELHSVEIKPTKATPHLCAHANDRAIVTQTTQSM